MSHLFVRSAASRYTSAPVLALAFALAGAEMLSGCSVMPPVPRPASPQQITASERASERVSAARSRSLERAVGGINAETVRAWVDRYTAPSGAATIRAKPREIYIDVAVLARRHVAWQLADELQDGLVVPTAARPLTIKLPPLAAPPSPSVATGAAAVRGGAAVVEVPALGELPVRAPRALMTQNSPRAAIVASRATLDDFLGDLRARQNDLELADSELARRALEDRIRASTRGAVEALRLAPVSPETALELSNLRLQLQAQLSAPRAQRAAAAAQIEAIEERLAAIWRRQTQQQNARIRAAFEDLPARLRREGLEALNAAATRRESERYYARMELRRLVEERLNNGAPAASDAPILRLLLPSARVPNAEIGPPGDISLRTEAPRIASAPAVRTTNVKAASVETDGASDAFEARPLGQNVPLASASVAELRAQARRDATEWVRQLALSWNARLGDRSAPDRTALAERTLFTERAGKR